MIAIYYYASTGQAYSISTASDLGLFTEPPVGSLAMLLTEPVNLPGYMNGSTYVPLPAAPSDNHVFNWSTKQWEDQRTLQEIRDARWEYIKAERDKQEVGLFEWGGHVFQADKERVNGAVTGSLIAQAAGQPYTDTWTLADNSTIPVSGSDIIAMGIALLQHVSACHAKGRVLRNQIYQVAQTIEDVKAVEWTFP